MSTGCERMRAKLLSVHDHEMICGKPACTALLRVVLRRGVCQSDGTRSLHRARQGAQHNDLIVD